MSFTVNAPALAHTIATVAAPAGATVESQVSASDPNSMPLVILGVSAPTAVVNGPNESSAAFTIAVRCYSSRRAEALSVCDAMYGGFFQAWREGMATDHGWLSRITQDSQQPQMVQSDLEADNVYRVDCVLDVIARH